MVRGVSILHHVICTLYIPPFYLPFLHLHCRTCTYVHPVIYMYVQPYVHPNTPLNTPVYTPYTHHYIRPKYTPLHTPHIQPIYTPYTPLYIPSTYILYIRPLHTSSTYVIGTGLVGAAGDTGGGGGKGTARAPADPGAEVEGGSSVPPAQGEAVNRVISTEVSTVV